MKEDRRDFLKTAGAAWTMAAVGGFGGSHARPGPVAERQRGTA